MRVEGRGLRVDEPRVGHGDVRHCAVRHLHKIIESAASFFFSFITLKPRVQ